MISIQIWYLPDEHTYGAVNRAHAEFMGRPESELAFRDVADCLSPEEAAACRVGNRAVFSERRQIETEEWVRGASGEVRLLHITKTPKVDDGGQVEFVVCTAEDIADPHSDDDRTTMGNTHE